MQEQPILVAPELHTCCSCMTQAAKASSVMLGDVWTCSITS